MLMPAGPVHMASTKGVTLAPSTTFPRGCVLYDSGPGTINGVTVSSVFSPFNGTGSPSCLLKRAAITDANGNITQGAQTGGMEFGQTYPSVDAYYEGLFKTQDLPTPNAAGGLTTASITRGNAQQIGVIIEGNITTGLLKL